MKIAVSALVLVACLFRVGAPVLGRGIDALLDNYSIMADEALEVRSDHADAVFSDLEEWSNTTVNGLDKATEGLTFGEEEEEVSGFTKVLFDWFLEGVE